MRRGGFIAFRENSSDFEKMIALNLKPRPSRPKALRDALDCVASLFKGNVTNSRSTAISDSTPPLAEVLEEAAVAKCACFPSMPLILAMIYASARIARLIALFCLIRAVKDDVIPYFTAHTSILPDDLRQRLESSIKVAFIVLPPLQCAHNLNNHHDI